MAASPAGRRENVYSCIFVGSRAPKPKRFEPTSDMRMRRIAVRVNRQVPATCLDFTYMAARWQYMAPVEKGWLGGERGSNCPFDPLPHDDG